MGEKARIRQTAMAIFILMLISGVSGPAAAAPVLTDLPNAVRILEDELTSFNFYVTGVGNYSFQILSNPETLVRNEKITFIDLGILGTSGDRWTIEIEPDENTNGMTDFIIRVTDGMGAHTDHGLQLTVIPVNDPPVAVGGSFRCNEDSILSGALSADDADGDPLAFGIDSHPSHGVLDITDPETGTFRYSPAPDFYGTDSFTFHADDGTTESVPADVTVVVDPINDPPGFAPGPDQTVLEDGGMHRADGFAADISRGADNEDAQGLEFFVTSDPDIFKTDPAIDPETGDLTFETEPDAHGTSSLTIRLRDDGGTGNGGADVSPPVGVVITVVPVNDPPVFTRGPDISVGINSGRYEFGGWASEMGAGPENEAGQRLLGFGVQVDFPELFSVPPAIDTNGTLTFSVVGDLSGHAVVSAVLKDDGGTENGGVDTSGPQTFVITANHPPDPPVAVFPPSGHVFSGPPVTLRASPFSDHEEDAHIETRWLIKKGEPEGAGRIRYGCRDGEFEEQVDDANSAADLTRHRFDDLEPGYTYIWKVGYKDSGSNIVSWSGEYDFKVGVSTPDAIRIGAATDATDFSMVSVVQQPDDPASAAVFRFAFDGSDSERYNTKRFRIGTFAPESGIGDNYVECGPDMSVYPGRAFWFYSKEDVDLKITGIGVSPDHDIQVELVFDDTGDDQWKGWNMIACPNKSAYNWNDVDVIVYDDSCTPVFEGKIPEAGEFVSPVFWKYEKGYVYHSAIGPVDEIPHPYDPDPFLMPHRGYWARVFRKNVFLGFSVSAQTQDLSESGNERTSRTRNAGVFSDRMADPPPPPFGRDERQISVTGEETGNGCFVSSTAATF